MRFSIFPSSNSLVRLCLCLLLAGSGVARAEAQSPVGGQGPAGAVEAPAEPPEVVDPTAAELAGKVADIEAMLADMEQRLGQIRSLNQRLEEAGSHDRKAILYRRDQRSLDLTRLLEAITERVMSLPPASERRAELARQLEDTVEELTPTVFTRLNDLDDRIDAQGEKLLELTGAERIRGEAYLKSLEELRFRYYEALIDFSNRRESLGLPKLEVLDPLPKELFQYAETQVGQVEFVSAAIKELQKRLASRPGQEDLNTALQTLRIERERYIGDLQIAIDLMNRLNLDSAPYRTVLLQEGGVVSFSLFEPAVMKNMLRGAWEDFRTAFLERAPDGMLRVLFFVLILALFYWMGRASRRITRRALEGSSSRISTLLKNLLVSMSGGIVIFIGLLVALSTLGISLGPMLAGLGVAGFIVGFALQDTLSNFASGAMILLYRPYDVDDFVEVSGATGLVKKMNLVSTTIATLDNQILVVPNNKIWGDVIKNVTSQKVRRVDMVFGISYRDDIPRTEEVLHEILAQHEYVLRSPEPMVRVHNLGDSSVDFVVRPWVRTEHYWDVYWDVTREVKMRFDREGISIPFPQRDVHMHQRPE